LAGIYLAMELQRNRIPDFRLDGCLPSGIFLASEAKATFRFGTSNQQRRRLVIRIGRWIELARRIKALRLFWELHLPPDFENRIAINSDAVVEFEEMLLTRRSEEIFAAEDETDWNEWVEFFSRTWESDGRRRGLVEIEL